MKEATTLQRAFWDACRELTGGVLTSQVQRAGDAYAAYHQRRAQQAERACAIALAADDLSDETRAAMLQARYTSTLRDAKLLTDAEATVLAHYRALPDGGRTVVNRLLEWASTTTTPPGPRRRPRTGKGRA